MLSNFSNLHNFCKETNSTRIRFEVRRNKINSNLDASDECENKNSYNCSNGLASH